MNMSDLWNEVKNFEFSPLKSEGISFARRRSGLYHLFFYKVNICQNQQSEKLWDNLGSEIKRRDQDHNDVLQKKKKHTFKIQFTYSFHS